jgi:biopolymer transport protein ExbB/TolQ
MISTSLFFVIYYVNKNHEKIMVYKEMYKSIRRIQAKIELNDEFEKEYSLQKYKDEIETIINSAENKIEKINIKNKKIFNSWRINE